MTIIDFLKSIISVIMDGSFDRVRIITALNKNFHESFISGGLDRHCRTTISAGDPEYKHAMSTIWLRSGFRISVENDYGMKDFEIFEISDYILENKTFIRQLMALGFDTLIVQGKMTKRGKSFCLHRYSNLHGYMLNE